MLFWDRSANDVSPSEESEFITRYYELLKKISLLEGLYSNLEYGAYNAIERLGRIVKYAREDKPTFNLAQRSLDTRVYDKSYTYDLYVYVDKEEYVVELSDLIGYNISEDDCYFEAKDNLVYFHVKATKSTLPSEFDCTKYEFIVDYKNGKYILGRKFILNNYDKGRVEE